MNYLELADEILTRLGAVSDDGQLSVTVRKSFVKAGIRRLEADLDNPEWLWTRETITTTAGDGTYAAPNDWAKTMSLRLTDHDQWLRYVGAKALDEDYGATADNTGLPAAWTQEGGILYLRPLPDSVLTIEHRYVKVEPVLSADGDTPLLPVRFHDAIVEWATSLAARRKGQYDRAISHEKAYEGWVKTMRDEQRRVTQATRIRGR